MAYAENFSIVPHTLPVVKVQGELRITPRRELEFLKDYVELPDDEFVSIILRPHVVTGVNDVYLGVFNTHGTVTCIQLVFQDRRRTLGRYFGYPECCVNEFIQTFGTVDHLFKLKGTGYIPCAACNDKSEYELVETINRNRKAPVPFPLVDKQSLSNRLKYLVQLKEKELTTS